MSRLTIRTKQSFFDLRANERLCYTIEFTPLSHEIRAIISLGSGLKFPFSILR